MRVTRLVTLVDAGWRGFRDAVRDRESRLDDTTATGWRLRDLVGHVVGWESETARRLAIFRVDGVQLEPFLGTDELNAESVRRYGALSTARLLDELDRTHSRLVGEVRSLSEAQLGQNDGWAASIVAGNTYEHYAEHAAEIAA